MGTVQATFKATENAFHIEGYEKIDFSLLYVDGAFTIGNSEIADSYRQFGRCLMVVDKTNLRILWRPHSSLLRALSNRSDRLPNPDRGN
jgi:hypothetical protein